MTTVAFGEKSTVVGELGNGMKMVFSEYDADDQTAGAVVVKVSPLKKVHAWTWCKKVDDMSGSSNEIDVTVTQGGAQSGLFDYTSSNCFTITTKAAATASGINLVVGIMSFGV